MMKRFLSFILVVLMILSLFSGCEKSAFSDKKEKDSKFSSDDESIYPIDTGFSPEEEALAINNQNTENSVNGENPKLDSDCYVISDYNPEWAFGHSARICIFKNKLYAAWSQGIIDEDAEGQRIAISSTPISDVSKWSSPVVAAEPGDGYLHKRIYQCRDIFTDGEKIYILFSELELDNAMYNADGTVNHSPGVEPSFMYNSEMIIESSDGENWSEPYNHDDCKAWFSDAMKYSRFSRDGCSSATVADAMQRGAAFLGETYTYLGKNKVIHLMARSNTGYVWQCASYDGGKEWTQAYPTEFTSAATMATFGNLPDGRSVFIGSVTYDVRYPLSLYVSDDGYNFNKGYTLRDEIYKMQKDGWAKGGEYAYADFICDDTYMYIIYSKQKEVIEMTRIKLSDI